MSYFYKVLVYLAALISLSFHPVLAEQSNFSISHRLISLSSKSEAPKLIEISLFNEGAAIKNVNVYYPSLPTIRFNRMQRGEVKVFTMESYVNFDFDQHSIPVTIVYEDLDDNPYLSTKVSIELNEGAE